MRKGTSISVMLAVVAGLMSLGTAIATASTTPRWVTHAQNYPGGISGGVRAYLDKGVTGAKPGLSPTSASAFQRAPLLNVQVNSLDSNPKVPQNETQVVANPNNPRIAIAAANDYVNGGSQIYRTNNGGQSWTTQFRSSATQETGDFCG